MYLRNEVFHFDYSEQFFQFNFKIYIFVPYSQEGQPINTQNLSEKLKFILLASSETHR